MTRLIPYHTSVTTAEWNYDVSTETVSAMANICSDVIPITAWHFNACMLLLTPTTVIKENV